MQRNDLVLIRQERWCRASRRRSSCGCGLRRRNITSGIESTRNRIGEIASGPGSELKYDAFPYQRYGVKYGRLTWLSPAASDSRDGGTFRARVEISESELLLHGQSRQLIAGMSGKAEIVVGSRSLIGYVLEPLRQLRETYSDVPEHLSKR